MALQNFNITFDVYGNLYFSNNSLTYQVNINNKNQLTLDEGNYPIIDNFNNIYKIKHLDENSLKNRVKQEKEKEKEKEDNGIIDSDEEDEEEENVDYYPEDADHLQIDDPELNQDYIDEDLINQYGEHNLQFTFWEPDITTIDSIKIHYRQDCDVMALYDTYIYDINNKLIFKSNSPDNSSIYRLKIYPTGELYFRPIGYSEVKYSLEVINNKLELKIKN